MEPELEPWRDALACPLCGGALGEEPGARLRCLGCARAWPQADPRYVDLLPPEGAAPQRAAWSRQQREMLEQYRELAADREQAILAYHSDFDPLAPVLARLGGRVVDVGGAQGLVRHWLPEGARYLVVDPETEWLDQGWERLADAFPCLARPPAFVRGLGERLPLRDACADVALSIFNLNHLVDPARGLAEMVRVLRPGGRLVLVLDDVSPRWGDLARGGSYAVRDAAQRRRLRLRWLWERLAGSRVQPEHLRIRERDLDAWTAGLEPLERRWRGAYLCRVHGRPVGSASR